jgi:membrane-bound lytic murein transglycosylase D
VKLMRALFLSMIIFELMACSNTLHYTYPPPSKAIVVPDSVEQPAPAIQKPVEITEAPLIEEKKPEAIPLMEQNMEQQPVEQPREEIPIPLKTKAPLEQKPQNQLSLDHNDRVKTWITKLTVKNREHFISDYNRFNRIRPVMEEIFDQHGIPRELVHLCLVESGGKAHAVSPHGATGYWQFLPDTARVYGLQVNKWVDERKNLEKSTEAAAHYLKNLYSIFNDWLLAIAAYNAGEGAIFRIIKTNKKINNFWDISRSSIKAETLEYVPKFIATVMISRDPEKYGLARYERIDPSPIPETVDRPSYLDRIARTETDYFQESIRNSNTVLVTDPHTDKGAKAGRTKAMVQGTVKHKVRKGDTLYALAKKYSLPVDALAEANGLSLRKKLSVGRVLTIPADPRKEPKRAKTEQTYTVARGDTLETISRKFGTTVEDMIRTNDLKDPEMIQPKTVLTIPSSKKAQASARTTQYKVKKGDTIWAISRHFDVSATDIRRWNRLDTTAQIKPGDKLTIYLQ